MFSADVVIYYPETYQRFSGHFYCKFFRALHREGKYHKSSSAPVCDDLQMGRNIRRPFQGSGSKYGMPRHRMLYLYRREYAPDIL